MEVSLSEIQCLLRAVERIPKFTPNRWNLISDLVRGCQHLISFEECPRVFLGGEGNNKSVGRFSGSSKECKDVYEVLQNVEGLHIDDIMKCLETAICQASNIALKPIILVPSVEKCCGYHIKIDPRPSFPLVYTQEGTLVAALFHGICRVCKMRFYYGYKEKEEGNEVIRIYNNPYNFQKYFQLSSCSLYEKRLLQSITHNIVFSACTFESRAEVYRASNKLIDSERLKDFEMYKRSALKEWCPSSQRIEEVWFMWVLVVLHDELGTLSNANLHANFGQTSKRRDIEQLCQTLWKNLCTLPNKWVMHSCHIKGCREGYVTVDGNEKLKRPKCAAPHSRVRLRRDLPEVVHCCTNYPTLGGKYKSPSRYCDEHKHFDEQNSICVLSGNEDDSSKSETSIESLSDCETFERNFVGDLPENDDDSLMVGCKKVENRTKYYMTTAGMLALIRPCGIVISMSEMYTCESPTQVFLFLLRTFVHDTDSVLHLRYLGYDRACDLKPFLVNQAKRGSAGAKLLLERVKFLVDTFHCEKHTEPSCMPPDNPKCEFHPSLPEFEEIHGTNTESCEQGFRRLNRYEYSTRFMTMNKRNVYFYFINDLHNKHLEERLQVNRLK